MDQKIALKDVLHRLGVQVGAPDAPEGGEKVTNMEWRNQPTHLAETKAVKEALVKAGYSGVKVGHGTGTAWGWLRLKVQVTTPAGCFCHTLDTGRRCIPCQAVHRTAYDTTIRIAQQVTGRHGDYDGRINCDIVLP